MDAAPAGAAGRAGRFDGLQAEAQAALAWSANTLRSIRDRYRTLYGEDLGRWQALRDSLDDADRRPPDRGQPALDVLRVLQEALQNVRKHAAASVVSVTTSVEDGDWVLEVRDDGRGFDVGTVAARGRRNFGLQFMRERAELIGARLDVRSRPDGGTVVRLAIPMGEEESRRARWTTAARIGGGVGPTAGRARIGPGS